MLDSLRSLGTRGSKLIRLDAFGYATKTPGTRCFFQVSLALALVACCHWQLHYSIMDNGFDRDESRVISDEKY